MQTCAAFVHALASCLVGVKVMLAFFKKFIDDVNKANGVNNTTTTPSTGAASQTNIEEFLPAGGGPLALAFGKHLVAGQLAYNKYSSGPPPSHRFAIWNGEGLGLGWDGVEAVTWAGKSLPLSPDGVTPGYHFHPGTFAHADPTNQGPDSFFTNPLHYNGTCYTAVLLPENLSVEQQPDKLRGVYRCLKMPIFNESGTWIDRDTATQYKYSTNPADIIAFGFWRSGLTARLHWPSWARFRAYCAAQITWNDGSGDREINRFEAHPVWTKPVPLNELLDTLGLITGMTWQDDGELVRFLLPNDQTVSHRFSTKNSTNFKPIPVKLRDRMNRLILKFRNVEDQWLKPSSVVIERETLWTRYGEIRQEIQLPNMTHSQARRIGEMIMRIATDNPNKASLEGYGDSFHLLEGDYCTVSHPVNGWNDRLCRINTITDLSASTRPDVRRFEVQRIDGPLYSDTDHKPIETELEPE